MPHRLLAALTLSVFVVQHIAVHTTVRAQDGNKPEGLKPLNHFVGSWSNSLTIKPNPNMPKEAKYTVAESTGWMLKERCIVGREISQQDGVKSMWIMTYDPQANNYPFKIFSSKGTSGGEWASIWDESKKSFLAQALDAPKGWTSGGYNRFTEKTTSAAGAWLKDDKGTTVFDLQATKTRQPAETGAKTVAAWSNLDQPASPLPPELKILERLTGSWDTVATFKPAEWTPKEERTTSKVTRKWILDGHFQQDTSEDSNGVESLSLTTYDPQQKAYRAWWYNSEGHSSKSTGQWDTNSQTLSFKADLGNGITSSSSAKFIDNDHHDWKVVIKDESGKLYFDAEWKVTRRKEK